MVALQKERKTKLVFLVESRGSKWIFLLILWVLVLAPHKEVAAEEVLLRLDFTHQPEGSAAQWLKQQGFKFKLDAKDLNPRFENHRLILATRDEESGLFIRKLNLAGVQRIRITWGVNQYPQGANWAKGVYRVPIAAMIFFGEKEIDSGAFYIPDAPYFIGLFLGEKAQEGRAYTANYYHKGGRYFCTPCSVPAGKTVTTVFNLDKALKQQFGISSALPVTSFAFQMNTEDTEGSARAFLKTVEFLSS